MELATGEQLNINLDRFKKESNVKSEWNELVGKFTDAINADLDKGRKPFKYKYIAMRLADTKMDNWDCWRFFRECEQANCPFGKAFFGRLK